MTARSIRESNIAKLPRGLYDALILGGGINGAVSAAALSARGARVALIDKRDFAGFTSQQSSNLAWGGIKYLESGDYVLVRKLCLSRNELLRSYPSRVKEIRFFATIDKGFRYPPWVPWLGTWVYWLFGNGFTQMPRFLTKVRIRHDEPVVGTDKATGGFEYSDAYLHDNDSLEKPLTREDIIAERCGVRPLVVRRQGNGKDQRDWTQLSRKHAIDVDRDNAHLSIYGGKLTDCINVGNEVSDIVAAFGVALPHRAYRWYGEPHRSVYGSFSKTRRRHATRNTSTSRGRSCQLNPSVLESLSLHR